VEIADAQKVKGLAPLACKTDRINAWVLAELARRDLVPAIWLPDPIVRAERERARWRLHLVRHRSSLKQRVHAVLLTHGKPCPSPTSSASAAASCSPDSTCPSRGEQRSRPACA
jgi:transposase